VQGGGAAVAREPKTRTPAVPQIVDEIGVVTTSHVRTVNVMKDVIAALLHVFGGETRYYSHLLNATLAAASDQLITRAKAVGADGIVNVRYETRWGCGWVAFALHVTAAYPGHCRCCCIARAITSPCAAPP